MTTYCTLAEVTSLLGIPDTDDDAHLSTSITAACRWIDKLCGRAFHQVSDTARLYRPLSPTLVPIDDLQRSGSGLVISVDAGDSGVFTSVSLTNFEFLPINGVGANGNGGWPVTALHAVGSFTFPFGTRHTVQVEGDWGWDSTPGDIKLAALQLSTFCFKNKEAPLGIAAITDLGALRARTPSIVLDLIAGYEREAAYGAPMVG